MDNEITKIIEGYNKEKEIIVSKLAGMTENFLYESHAKKVEIMKERISEIDKKIDAILERLLKPTP